MVLMSVLMVSSGCTGTAERGSSLAVVVTTSILGDVVTNVVNGGADVVVMMPIGADPHDFEPSARQVAALRSADLIVANGLGLEESLSEVMSAAVEDGVLLLEVGPDVDPLPLDDSGGFDPHVWLDPIRMVTAVDLLVEALGDLDDSTDWAGRAAAYRRQLIEVDASIRERLAFIPNDERFLFTGHQAFGYFADRYGFEVTATILPGASTMVEPSASSFADVVEALEASRVPAVFTDRNESQALAEQLIDQVSREVVLVQLYTGALGGEGSGAETYIDLMKWNAEAIAGAFEQ